VRRPKGGAPGIDVLYAVRDVTSGVAYRTEPFGETRRCFRFLRDPWARIVSAWFYPGHHPPDQYGVGWPPVSGFVDGRRRLESVAHVSIDAAATTWSWTDKTDKAAAPVEKSAYTSFRTASASPSRESYARF